MGKPRRSFTPEFKQDAVDLCRCSGKSECQVARELGIPQSTLNRWMRQAVVRLLCDDARAYPFLTTHRQTGGPSVFGMDAGQKSWLVVGNLPDLARIKQFAIASNENAVCILLPDLTVGWYDARPLCMAGGSVRDGADGCVATTGLINH